MRIALSDEVKQLVDRANFAHLATLMSDGAAGSVAERCTRRLL